eukprot:8026751-Pyramimonas_sp.AAC.1
MIRVGRFQVQEMGSRLRHLRCRSTRHRHQHRRQTHHRPNQFQEPPRPGSRAPTPDGPRSHMLCRRGVLTIRRGPDGYLSDRRRAQRRKS